MNKLIKRGASAPTFTALTASTALVALALATPASAQSNEPIKIGVIAEATAVAGSSIPQAAQLAADEINAAGGVNGRKIRDRLLRQPFVGSRNPCAPFSAPSARTTSTP